MSLCVPFLAFTSLLLIPTGFLVLGELPPQAKLLGVILVVAGSLLMHRRLFALGWTAPAKAILREKGCRYMLMVTLIFAITSPLEKKLVLMTDIYTQALVYGLGMSAVFWIFSLVRHEDFRAALRNNIAWIATAGVLDALAMLLQFASYRYIDVVIAISIKRAGIVLSVFFGWLFFRERGITDKLIAASVMFAGVLILYLPVTTWQAVLLAFATLIFLQMALYWTRHQAIDPASGVPGAKAAAGDVAR
jgi:drug/metabolite transporter (DMT)-like permease